MDTKIKYVSDDRRYKIVIIILVSIIVLFYVAIPIYRKLYDKFFIYYKKEKSIVVSTLLTILGFVIYIGVFTVALPYVPGLEFLNNLHIGIQFGVLAGALVVSFALHLVVYKVSSKRLEKVDF